MSYRDCVGRLIAAAGRQLSDQEVSSIFERIHRAALDIRAGRVEGTEVKMTGKLAKEMRGAGAQPDVLLQEAAQHAAAQLEKEAALVERQAELQIVRLGARQADIGRAREAGIAPIKAPEYILTRDYTGRLNMESLEQRVAGYEAYFGRKLMDTWEAFGNDYLGFFQDRGKLLNLVRELRGEDTGEALAKKGAKAFHDTAEEARQVFNANGGEVGKLDDWGMPQHHSQERVAAAGKEPWIDQILPWLDRARYTDDLGTRWNDGQMREFLGHAWDTIATNGHANAEPGKYQGPGKLANRHAEHRQIHFKDAESTIAYWEAFGERTALEILLGHTETMARDIGFIEHFGPNPNMTWGTIVDQALKDATLAEPTKTPNLEGRAVHLQQLYDYAAGRVKPTYNRTVRGIADGLANLNTAGKLGGAALASLFGDKVTMEAVSHLNDLPMFQRWRTEMALLNPVNVEDRQMLQRQGLMLDSVRSGLQRFYEGLGQSTTTGKLANAVMRITGMEAINSVRKAAFGLNLMSVVGEQLKKGVEFERLQDSDIRTLRNYGITPTDWNTWKLASLQDMGHGNKNVITPEAISRIPEADLRAASIIGAADGTQAADAARRNAIVKLLGAVNTESEFAIVYPGWKERATFYGDLQRGTVKGEIARSVLQFKSFPWAFFQRGMDAVANMEGPTSKAAMTAWLITSTTMAGAMIMQTRDMLAGKDPRDMMDKNWYKFWGAAFLQGGALGIYGDFLYSINQTRMGSGPLEAMAGPTLGPLLEIGAVLPMAAARQAMEGKDTHLAAQLISRGKGFVPGNNIWYTKAATEHLVWQRVMEALSPGYLNMIRQKTAQEFSQDWWWRPGQPTPERAPALSKAIEGR